MFQTVSNKISVSCKRKALVNRLAEQGLISIDEVINLLTPDYIIRQHQAPTSYITGVDQYRQDMKASDFYTYLTNMLNQ